MNSSGTYAFVAEKRLLVITALSIVLFDVLSDFNPYTKHSTCPYNNNHRH